MNQMNTEHTQLRAEVEKLAKLYEQRNNEYTETLKAAVEIETERNNLCAQLAASEARHADAQTAIRNGLDREDALKAQLAAAQEALREIAAAAAPLVKIGIPAYSSQDDCRYQVPFYDCPDDLVLYQDGMGGSITVGAVRALRAAIDAARAKEDTCHD